VVFPGLKMWDTFACATAIFLTYFIISIAVLENVPPDAGLQKRATFSTLYVGLAGTGNWTRATCVASSGTNRSAIYYASHLNDSMNMKIRPTLSFQRSSRSQGKPRSFEHSFLQQLQHRPQGGARRRKRREPETFEVGKICYWRRRRREFGAYGKIMEK
jgi:hypothetical protein